MYQKQNKSDTVCIGSVVGVSGIKGTIKIKSFSDIFWFDDSYDSYLNSGKAILSNKESYFNIIIDSIRHYKSDVFLCNIKDIDDRNKAENLVGSDILIPKEFLLETEENEFYNFELINMTVILEDKIIGKVINVNNFGAGTLLDIKLNDNKKSNYFPFNKEDILEINKENKIISINKNSVWIQYLLENDKQT